MAQPQRRRCRLCSTVDAPAAMVLLGFTASKPGWCGGPRQGGRPAYAHQRCIDAQAERDAVAAERREAALAATRAYLAECRAAGVQADPERLDDLMDA